MMVKKVNIPYSGMAEWLRRSLADQRPGFNLTWEKVSEKVSKKKKKKSPDDGSAPHRKKAGVCAIMSI